MSKHVTDEEVSALVSKLLAETKESNAEITPVEEPHLTSDRMRDILSAYVGSVSSRLKGILQLYGDRMEYLDNNSDDPDEPSVFKAKNIVPEIWADPGEKLESSKVFFSDLERKLTREKERLVEVWDLIDEADNETIHKAYENLTSQKEPLMTVKVNESVKYESHNEAIRRIEYKNETLQLTAISVNQLYNIFKKGGKISKDHIDTCEIVRLAETIDGDHTSGGWGARLENISWSIERSITEGTYLRSTRDFKLAEYVQQQIESFIEAQRKPSGNVEGMKAGASALLYIQKYISESQNRLST